MHVYASITMTSTARQTATADPAPATAACLRPALAVCSDVPALAMFSDVEYPCGLNRPAFSAVPSRDWMVHSSSRVWVDQRASRAL
jgi:hypothetical protein